MVYKVDNNQLEIVRAARKIGAFVKVLSEVGHGFPDLLIAFGGVIYLCEVKLNKSSKLTPRQKDFIEKFPCPVYRIESVDNVIDLLLNSEKRDGLVIRC